MQRKFIFPTIEWFIFKAGTGILISLSHHSGITSFPTMTAVSIAIYRLHRGRIYYHGKGNPTQGNIFLSYMEKHYINYFTGDLSRSFSSNDFIYSYYISGYSFLLETTVIFYSGTSDYGII